MNRSGMALLALWLAAAPACRAPEGAPPHDVSLTGAKFVEMLPDIMVPRRNGGFRSAGDQLAGLVLIAVADWERVEPQADEHDQDGRPIGYGFCLEGPSDPMIDGWRVHNSSTAADLREGTLDPGRDIVLSRDAAAACAIGPHGLITHPADIRLDDDPLFLVALPAQFIALRPARESWWRVRDIDDRGWHSISCDR